MVAVLPVLSMIGVPSSAGSYAAGQDQAPRALRAAGPVEALGRAGLDVHDAGDLTEQVWAPDREDRLAQNIGLVVASVQELADRVPGLVVDDRRLLVLGGNCTIALGVVAGLDTSFGRGCGLLYVDRHFDMNTPATTIEGALDWMGLAHAHLIADPAAAATTALRALPEAPFALPRRPRRADALRRHTRRSPRSWSRFFRLVGVE